MKNQRLKIHVLKTICLILLVVLSTSCFSLFGTAVYNNIKSMQTTPPAEVETETPETPSVTKASTATYKVTAEEKRIISELTSNEANSAMAVEGSSYGIKDITLNYGKDDCEVVYKVVDENANFTGASISNKDIDDLSLLNNCKSTIKQGSLFAEKEISQTSANIKNDVIPMTSEQASKSTASYILDNHVIKAKSSPEQFVQTFAETYANNDVFYINKASGIISFLTALNNGYTFKGKTVSTLCSIDFDGAVFDFFTFQGIFNGGGNTYSNLTRSVYQTLEMYTNGNISWRYFSSEQHYINFSFADASANYFNYSGRVFMSVEFVHSLTGGSMTDFHLNPSTGQSENPINWSKTQNHVFVAVSTGELIEYNGEYYKYGASSDVTYTNYYGGQAQLYVDAEGNRVIENGNVKYDIIEPISTQSLTIRACPTNKTFQFNDAKLAVSALTLGRGGTISTKTER